MRRANQATRMKNMFNAKTKFAQVGDLIKFRLDQRDVKKNTNMQHVIIGFAYSITAAGGAFMVTTEGIVGKKRTGRTGGVKPIPIPPDQYTIMNEHVALSESMQAIRVKILTGVFETNNHDVRCVTALRDDLIKNFNFLPKESL